MREELLRKMDENLKIRKRSAVEQVCERIKGMIAGGTWQLHQKLPSENELSEMFGVNRLTVRGALQRLNALGILDTRVGDGTYVCSFNFDQHIRDISGFYITPKLVKDVTEFRMLFEVECARLAIEKYTPEDLEELRRRCVRFEEASDRFFHLYEREMPDPAALNAAFEELNRADLDFHSQICAMTHNDLLVYAFAVAKPAIFEHITASSQVRVPNIALYQWNCSAAGHWNLFRTIQEKDFEACKTLYMAMVDPENTMPYLQSGEDAGSAPRS